MDLIKEVPLQLFVYGTLMNGYCNNFLMDGCRYIGKAKSKEKYALYVTEYPIVRSFEQKMNIHGEVYEVTDSIALKQLDQLEGHPDWYIRTAIDVEMIDSPNELITAQIYFNDRETVDDSEYIESGNCRDSKRCRIHLATGDQSILREC